MSREYDLIRANPVARFHYQGNHSHAVRRTVLVIENTRTIITGYELREGNIVRNLKNAPIKSYTKTKIADKTRDNIETFLTRTDLLDLVENGA